MLTYIILAAGKGNNLQPLTLKYAKTSYKLDEETTVLQRMVRSIRHADKNAEIVVVVGYKAEEIRKELDGENVVFVMNPFYEVTNSISSVWFARGYLERENVAIVHGDAVFSDVIKDKLIITMVILIHLTHSHHAVVHQILFCQIKQIRVFFADKIYFF